MTLFLRLPWWQSRGPAAVVTAAALAEPGAPGGISLRWADESGSHPCYVRDTASPDGTAFRTVVLYLEANGGFMEYTIVSGNVPAGALPASDDLIGAVLPVIVAFHP